MDGQGTTKSAGNPHAGHRQRLRHIYRESGPENMLTHQLLELLLTYALPRIDTNILAHRLLGKDGFGSAGRLFGADAAELMKMSGVGENTAILISLVGELSRRMDVEQLKGEPLSTPDAVMRYCLAKSAGGRLEKLHMISLDSAFNVLHTDLISSGLPSETTVYPRTVVEIAIRWGAEYVVLFHNHPTGDIAPSRQDYETTKSIVAALSPIGIGLKDHVITGGSRAYSMAMETEIFNGAGRSKLAAVAQRKE